MDFTNCQIFGTNKFLHFLLPLKLIQENLLLQIHNLTIDTHNDAF